jgi:hypothetical protein
MTREEDTLERLRRHIDDLAEDEIQPLLEEARVEARAQVRAMLVEAIAERMLAKAEEELAGEMEPYVRTREPLAGTTAHTPRTNAASSSPRRAPLPESDARPPAREARASGSGRGPLGWYVYGVVAEGWEPAAPIDGIDGEHPVTVVSGEGIAAIASRVPLDEFGEDVLTEQVEDLAWLEDNARRHETILDRVREQTTLVPMRLCTIYNTDTSVREMLAREHEFLADALRRLEGRTEWGVKVFADLSAGRARAEEPSDAAREADQRLRESGPGAAYMLEKQLEGIRDAEAEGVLEDCCATVHARLSTLAVEAKLNPPQPRELTKRDEQMLLNGVYLVDDAASGEFASTAAAMQTEYAGAGIDVELSGPWPPYNFVNDASELGR